MTMYKHRIPSTTSFSDDDADDDRGRAVYLVDHDSQPIVVSPAQWSKRRTRSTVLQSPSPMSNLPAEILIHIFKHLVSPRDLYTSLRVCRAWCECSVELLWHKPGFTSFETLEKMSKLLGAPNQTFAYSSFIRRLNFIALSKNLNDDVFAALAKCDRLERLTLVNCVLLTSNVLTRVLPSFPNLVAIDVSDVISTTDEAVIGLASSARRLQGINLTGCKNVTDAGVLALAETCPFLRRVKLSNLELLTDASVSALAKACPLLLEVDLNHCKLITDLSVRDIWIYCSQMREMKLSHCPDLTDAAFPAPLKEQALQSEVPNPFPSSAPINSDKLPPLDISRTFEHLRMLDLTACPSITDDAIEGIISHAPKIRNLVLSKCTLLTDRSVENICRLGRHLHYLHLGHAEKITDRSVRTLARSCTRLRYVDFANCTLLTDMSVFELSALPKLRRVGLVRVNNLTDEAIYALAERHATLERIHLSYCDQISVMAIHFLLQKLHKLTHLSLTGVPAFRQPELQAFCRDPPSDFNSNQQSAFCVFSGKGVSQLRAFLTELFDRITEMNGTDDTEYEDDDDDELEEELEDAGEEEREDVEEAYDSQPVFHDMPPPVTQPSIHPNSAPDDESAVFYSHPIHPVTFPPTTTSEVPSTSSNLQGATDRLNKIMASLPSINPNAGPSRRLRQSGNRTMADMLPIVENSTSPPPSDVASNLSGGTNQSNGAGFFRTYQDGVPSRNSGVLTPDLNFAEIGHGRGAQTGTSQYPLRRGHEHLPHHRPPLVDVDLLMAATPLRTEGDRAMVLTDSSNSYHTPGQSAPDTGVSWPYREPLSPVPSNKESPEPMPSTSNISDVRGRSVKRSFRNTLNAAEHYATSFLFGRSPTRNPHDETGGPSNSRGH
ncbi:hypothetical protein DFS33DRAFT_1314054 [Desarmillaria ectypa]|nr:hypothetical protein DFS33DRAFT_1314054 [Desarmillaria ectypa]